MLIQLPASMQADWLILRRAGWPALARAFAAPVLLVLGCVALACVPVYGGADWLTLVSAVLALAGSFTLVRGGLTGMLARARLGWCGALPVRAQDIVLALLGLTGVALAGSVALGTVLLALVAIPVPNHGDLGIAMLALDGGLVVGTLVATGYVLRPGASVRVHHTEGIREPLFALPWLNDPRLPHLLDWQRRAALVRWRRGGSFVFIGCVLVAVPTGAVTVVALVLLALSLAWFTVVLRACTATTSDARRLLGAIPLELGSMRLASLRYPLVASICAVVLAVIGAALLRSFVPLVVWAACLIVVAAWPIWSIFRATQAGHSA